MGKPAVGQSNVHLLQAHTDTEAVTSAHCPLPTKEQTARCKAAWWDGMGNKWVQCSAVQVASFTRRVWLCLFGCGAGGTRPGAGLTAGGDVLGGLAWAQGQCFFIVILRWGGGGQRRRGVCRNLWQKHQRVRGHASPRGQQALWCERQEQDPATFPCWCTEFTVSGHTLFAGWLLVSSTPMLSPVSPSSSCMSRRSRRSQSGLGASDEGEGAAGA